MVDTEEGVSAGPREGPEELELRGGLEDDEEDVIETVGNVVGILNKSFKALKSRDAFESSAEAKDGLAKAEARLDRLEGAVSMGDAEEDVCLLFDEEI